MNCHKSLPIEKAVYSLSSGRILTCQYPLLRSKVENQDLPDNLSKVWSILGNGYESLIVLSFNFRKSTQNLRVPSFFCFNTTGEHQELEHSSITPCFCMSLRPCKTQISIFFKSTFKRLFGKRLYADFFLDNSIGFFMRYPCLKSGQLQISTYRQYGFYLIK